MQPGESLRHIRSRWLLWSLLGAVQLAFLANLALAPHLPVVPLTLFALLLLVSAFLSTHVLIVLVTVSIIVSESLYLELGGMVVRTTDVVLLYALLVLFMKWLAEVDDLEKLPALNWALGLLLLFGALSLVRTISWSNSALEMLQIVELCIAALVFFNVIRTRAQINLVFLTLLVYSVLDALWIVIRYQQGLLHGRHIGLFGTLANELNYGVAVSVGAFYLVRRGWLRLGLLLAASLQFAAIYIARGRGLLITAILMALVTNLAFALYQKRLRPMLLALVTIVTANVLFFALFEPEIQARYASIIAGGRLIMWAVALKIWQTSPVFGIGVGNIELAAAQFLPKPVGIVLLAIEERLKSPHSEYLSFAVQGGWIGLAFGLAFYGGLLRHAFLSYMKADAEAKPAAILLFSFLVGLTTFGLANDLLLAGKGMFVMLLLAMMARLYVVSNGKTNRLTKKV